jgi:hypothetical protein
MLHLTAGLGSTGENYNEVCFHQSEMSPNRKGYTANSGGETEIQVSDPKGIYPIPLDQVAFL